MDARWTRVPISLVLIRPASDSASPVGSWSRRVTFDRSARVGTGGQGEVWVSRSDLAQGARPAREPRALAGSSDGPAHGKRHGGHVGSHGSEPRGPKGGWMEGTGRTRLEDEVAHVAIVVLRQVLPLLAHGGQTGVGWWCRRGASVPVASTRTMRDGEADGVGCSGGGELREKRGRAGRATSAGLAGGARSGIQRPEAMEDGPEEERDRGREGRGPGEG